MRFKGAAVAAALVAIASCNRGQPPGAGAFAFPPAAVKVAPVQTTDIEDATEYVATLRSLNSTTIQPQIDGQITQIFVKSGDGVKAGAPLIQIDPRRQQAMVSTQEAERAVREANVSFSRQQEQRASELFKAGAISKQELEQAETALRTAEANLKSLESQVQQQEVQLRYYTVTAPTSGIVGDIPVRIGNQVSPQTVLTTIDQNATLEVHVSVPIEHAGVLRIGLPMTILSSDSREPLAATTVGFISPHVDDETQSVLVKGTVRNPSGKLRAAQFVLARIVWKTTPGTVIPVTAVLRVNGQFFAFVAEEAPAKPGGPGGPAMVARQRPIKLGPIAGDDYPVLDGLKQGDRVVVSGVQNLADGAPIAPTP